MAGIIMAIVGSVNSWALVIYWYCFANRWEPGNPVITVIGIPSMFAAVLLGSMLVRENRLIGWIAIGSGSLCILIGLLTPQL